MTLLKHIYVVICLLVVVGAQIVPQCPPQDSILPCRCLERIGEYQIWCSHSDLPRVLSAFPSIGKHIVRPVDELILENNNLPSLPGRTFSHLKIVRLMLRYNGLERVSSTWLLGLEDTLMELYLVEPQLKSLPENSLNRLVALEAITIQSNMLKRLPSFASLPKLNYLQLESASLIELSPRHFQHLPSLEKIHISGSPLLIRLEMDVFQDLPSLKLLNVSNTGVSWLHPRAITGLPSLRELSLVGNKISDASMVGRGIRDLPNLQILHLDYNVIEFLGETSFVDLPALKMVSLSYNRIVELAQGAFHRVPKLKTINLNHNMVKHVHPKSFLDHTPIEEVWLVDNDIDHVLEIRAILEALPRLTYLDLSYNNIEVIPYGSLRPHGNLERLNLNYNNIRYIEREAIIDMPTLRELSLKNNSLSDIFEYPLWDLPNLKGLDLSENNYQRIEPGLLTNLPSLRRLDMSSNLIDYIDHLSFLDTPALEYINISFNSLVNLHPSTFRHLVGLYELDVSSNRLLQFVSGLPKGLEYLHVKKNKIANLPLANSPDLDLTALKMLDLSSNTLKNIRKSSLRSMPSLRKLYLGKNFLRHLEDGAFGGLTQIEILDLQGNQLVRLPNTALVEMGDLKALNLRNNKLTTISQNFFLNNRHLSVVDLSRNQLKDISPGAFETSREMEVINASHNYLTTLPDSIHELRNLKVLDLTNNHLTEIEPDLLSNLKSLTELRLSDNLIQELKTAAFDNLDNLRILYLNNNELKEIHTNAFRSLSVLKHIKLNENRIRFLPDFTLNNLPNLQMLELQDNLIQKISKDAFYLVPHILMLNLSTNLISDMNQAGLQNLKSLELLDVSFNRLVNVESPHLNTMEWLVELKMDSNAICGIRGVSFNNMPRLRVLSMRNNKMMSFPERAVDKLRGNLAVLDIDGNPLSCSCSLLWLRAWLQESSSVGPRCIDGTLLIESRLSREECMQESRLLEPVADGCESELLSLPHPYDTTKIFSPWMRLKGNSSERTKVRPPEEPDYFFDEYVDYPYNETITETSNNLKDLPLEHKSSSTEKLSPHITPGDTPTLYAATRNRTKDIPKEVSGSPSSSGFTFFGVPLPSFNINNLWNNARQADKTLQVPKTTLTTKTTKMNEIKPVIQQAERKSAIVNKPIRGDSSRKMFPPSIPSLPEVQTGGFVPLLPGSGGFKPIPNPNIKPEVQIEKIDVKILNVSESKVIPTTVSPKVTKNPNLGHPIPTPITPQTSTTQIPNNKLKTTIFVAAKNETVANITTASTTKKPNLHPKEIEQIKTLSEFLSTTTPLPLKINNSYADIELPDDDKSFDDIFKEVIENVSLPPNLTEPAKPTTQTIILSNTTISPIQLNTKVVKNITKPALLIPGGLQPQYRPSGRSKITKVLSPHSSSAPMVLSEPSGVNITALPHNRDEVREEMVSPGVAEDDKSWYFATYNESKKVANYNYYGNSGNTLMSIDRMLVMTLSLFLFKVV